jgi:hypothetical protein
MGTRQGPMFAIAPRLVFCVIKFPCHGPMFAIAPRLFFVSLNFHAMYYFVKKKKINTHLDNILRISLILVQKKKKKIDIKNFSLIV